MSEPLLEDFELEDRKTADQALDIVLAKVGYGTFHKKLLIMCGLGWLADNMWLQTVAIILPRIQEYYKVSDRLIGVLSSSSFAGMTIGAFFWGTLSDTKGRKMPYTMTLVITCIFGTLSSFTFNFTSLCITLFLLGFGVGGSMPTDGALYLEFLPKEYHYLLTFMSIFFSFGAVIASILGYLVLPCEGEGCDNSQWRTMLLAASFTTFVILLIRSFLIKLPETPKFLMNQGKTEETATVLQNIARINGRQVNREDLIVAEYYDDFGDIHEAAKRGAFGDLMSTKWRKTVFLIWSIWTFTSVAYTIFNVFLPKFLESVEQSDIKPTLKQIYWDYMIYSLSGMPGSVIASYMIETQLGRKGTMALSALGSSLSLLVFSAIKLRLVTVLSSSSVSFLGTLLYAVIYGYTPEVFDTSVRGTAVGTASALGRIAGIGSPVLAGFLFTINSSLPLYVSIVGYLCVGVCILLLPFETRNRK
ncbi:major facilitator superfamily domain-containing protein [Sporodiniella umbellata]|nr:major facilitator superfamily domain-containing protein [Sporodiniella umbellata]